MRCLFLNGCAEEYGKLPVHTPNQLEETRWSRSGGSLSKKLEDITDKCFIYIVFAGEERKCITCKTDSYFHLLKRRVLVNEVDSGDVLGNEVKMEGKALVANGL